MKHNLLKSGEDNRDVRKRDIEQHIIGKAQVLEMGTDAPVEDIKWEVQKAEVHSTTRLEEDEGDGRPIILRQFRYNFPPGPHEVPTSEKILTPGYIKFLESTLYLTDELDLVQKPKAVIDEKGFSIFATCQARKGSIIPWQSKPQTLTEAIQKQ